MPEQLTKEELKSLAAESRQEMLKMLAKRPYTASEISKIMGKHVTTVAEHLENLEKTGLIKKKEDGHKWKYYELTGKGSKLLKPQFYTWTILLGASLFSIIIGGGLLGAGSIGSSARFDSGAEALQAPAIAPIEAVKDLGASTVPALPAEMAIAYLLIVLGIAGIAAYIWKKKKEKRFKEPR